MADEKTGTKTERVKDLHKGRQKIETKFFVFDSAGQYIKGSSLRIKDGKFGEFYQLIVDEKPINLPTLTALNSKLENVPINATDVIVEYIGENPSDKGKDYKDFDVSFSLPENESPIYRKQTDVPF